MIRINTLKLILWFVVLGACNDFKPKTQDASSKSQILDTSSDSQISNVSSKSFDVSLNKVATVKKIGDRYIPTVGLKVEGESVKYIEGYKLTNVFTSGNSQEIEVKNKNSSRSNIKPLGRDGEWGKGRKWFKPSVRRGVRDNKYVEKRIENDTFYPLGIPIPISDETMNPFDLKGELTLVLATEQNKCAYRVKDFLAEGKLTDQPFEFDGGAIKFVEEPDTLSYSYDNQDDVFYRMKFLLEDTEKLLFDIYFEDAAGKEIYRGRSFGLKKGEEDIYFVDVSFKNKLPSKSWAMVIVSYGENCKVTIPFELKNIDVVKK